MTIILSYTTSSDTDNCRPSKYLFNLNAMSTVTYTSKGHNILLGNLYYGKYKSACLPGYKTVLFLFLQMDPSLVSAGHRPVVRGPLGQL